MRHRDESIFFQLVLPEGRRLKKVVIDRPGGYRRLKIRECSPPVPMRNEVLVAVSAAGVNFADVIIRMGLYRSAKTYVGWPITPGFEFSGRVL